MSKTIALTHALNTSMYVGLSFTFFHLGYSGARLNKPHNGGGGAINSFMLFGFLPFTTMYTPLFTLHVSVSAASYSAGYLYCLRRIDEEKERKIKENNIK